MSVFEKREAIIQNQNTAQAEFESLLTSFPTSTPEISVNKTLHGDINLDVLKSKGYRSVKTVTFSNPIGEQRGEITSVSNVPMYVKKLVITNQLLTTINLILPETDEVNLEQNYLKSFDAITLRKCKKLVLNMNELTELKNLPASLEELYVNDNKLAVFDFKDTPNLRVLHCKHNPNIKLVNVPRGNVDIKLDDDDGSASLTPGLQYADEPDTATANSITNGVAVHQQSYDESLHEYFKLKNKYETAEYALRKKAYEKHRSHKLAKQAARNVIPPCVNCARKVGSVFTVKDNRYIAVCGDKTKPCNLRFELFRGNHDNLFTMLEMYRTGMEERKEEIIRQKMDTLFNFVDEKEAVRQFKEKLEDFNLKSSLYRDYMDVYLGLFDNEHKRALIRTKMENVYRLKDTMGNMASEFERNGNRAVLQTLVGIYQKEYAPEILNLRRLQHEVMEMNETDETTQVLFQYDVALSRLDYLWGEPARVISASNK